MACSVTEVLIFVELHRVNSGTNNSKYHLKLGTTAACMKRVIETTKGSGKRNAKGATNDCFIFESWFSSKRSAYAAISVGEDKLCMVKPNTKVLCMEGIENSTKDWTGGS